jgi:hypothetical protein
MLPARDELIAAVETFSAEEAERALALLRAAGLLGADEPPRPPYLAVPIAQAGGWEIRDARGVACDYYEHEADAKARVRALNAAPPESSAGQS